jgi:hypothetical protein
LVTDQVDFNEVWDVLSQSLREIHHKNASSLSFEALYRNAYKLVLKKFGDRLYQHVKQLVVEHLQHVAVRDVKPLVPSAVVTGSVGSAIEKRNGGSKFLEQLKAVWEDHQLCMSMITDVLMYMVRTFLSITPWLKVRVLTYSLIRIGYIARITSCPPHTLQAWGYFVSISCATLTTGSAQLLIKSYSTRYKWNGRVILSVMVRSGHAYTCWNACTKRRKRGTAKKCT